MATAHKTAAKGLPSTLSMAALVFLLVGCGDDFDPRSLLVKYRILAIQAEPAELLFDLANPAGARATLRIVDFDPASVGMEPSAAPPKYSWSFCTLTTGGFDEYACLDPLTDHPFGGNTPEATFDLAEQLPVLLADLNKLAQASGARPGDVDLRSVGLTRLPLLIRVVVEHASVGTVTTVKTLNLYLPPDPESDSEPPVLNTNPKITGFKVGGLDACPETQPAEGCFVAAPLGSPTLKLEVEIEPGSAEACGQEDLDAYRCDSETGRESLFYSWYTTAGEVKFALTNSETLENQLELPTTFPDGTSGKTMPVRLFVAVRDGRGGIDIRDAWFLLTETPESAASNP